jgi:hypothetical protein
VEELCADGVSAGVVNARKPEKWVHRQLLAGKGLMLVDGVDELTVKQRRAVQVWLRALLHEYPETPVIVTSRPAAASVKWLSRESFLALTLQPMSFDDVASFCERWHAAVADAARNGHAELPFPPDEIDSYRVAVAQHLESRRHLQQLATNPLLCALICALNLNRRSQLPLDRMSLYRSAIELLIDRRDSDRAVPASSEISLDAEFKIALLQRLAWRLVLRGRAEMSLDEASSQIGSMLTSMRGVKNTSSIAIVKYLLERSGLIREPTVGRIDFVHRTFQEYLAGREAADDHWFDELIARAHRDQWRETIIMAVGHATSPHRKLLLDGILGRARVEPQHARNLMLLAGACLDACRKLELDTLNQVEDAVRSLIPPRSRSEVGSLVLAGSSVVRNLPTTLDSLPLASARACVRAAALINGDDALELLATYASDEREEVQAEVLESWKYFDPERYATQVLADAALPGGYVSISSVAQARQLPRLSRLRRASIRLTEPVDDLSWLREIEGISLVDLDLGPRNCSVSDLIEIAPFAESLQVLKLKVASPRSNLRGLGGFPRLTTLRLHVMWETRSVQFLEWLDPTSLQSLWFMSGTGSVEDYSVAARFPKLVDFTVHQAKRIKGMRFLENFPLEELLLGGVESSIDCKDFLQWRSTLKKLYLFDGCSVFHPEALGELEMLDALFLVEMNRNSMVSLLDFVGLPKLEILNLGGSRISNLNGIASFSSLRSLEVGAPGDTVDVSPLAHFPSKLNVGFARRCNVQGLEQLPKNVRWHGSYGESK